MSHLGILNAWNYAWSVLTACFVLGIAIYLLDRKVGTRIYRFAYDFFHKDPLPKNEQRGFLYDQSTNRGVTIAVFLSSVYSLYMLWELGFAMSFIAELIIWLLMPPALIGGFWSGRVVYKILLRRSIYFDKADEFGEKLESMKIGEMAKDMRGKGASLVSRLMSIFPSRRVPTQPTTKPEPISDMSEEPKTDFRAELRKYTRR